MTNEQLEKAIDIQRSISNHERMIENIEYLKERISKDKDDKVELEYCRIHNHFNPLMFDKKFILDFLDKKKEEALSEIVRLKRKFTVL